MTLFGGKKRSGDQLRTLSEKEIQDKLYGSFRNATGSVRDFDLGHRETPQATITIAKPPAADLYKAPAAKPEAPKPVTLPAERAKSWQVAPKAAETKASAPQRSKTPQPGLGAALAKFLKRAGENLVLFFRDAVTLFIQVILALDFRKPKVRLAAYWCGGAIFLGVLLAGIHFLNIQREAAMKSPRKVTAPRVTAKAAPAVTVKKKAVQAREESAPISAATAETEDVSAAPQEFHHIGSHVIQIATFAAESDARKLAERLKGDSLPSFVKPLTRSSGKVYYCVFIGRFPDAATAEKKLEDFKKREISGSFQDAFVRTI